MKILNIIDLFAGAGGFSLGFKKYSENSRAVQFVPIWANDFNKDAVATYNANFGNHCVPGDIIDILKASSTIIPQAEIVIGGPPCQGFSLLNRNRDTDVRKQLWRPFMQIVEESNASIFVMENVPELLASDEFKEIEEAAISMGFMLKKAKLITADYGVPQVRTRAFIMGSKLADPSDVFPPLRTHYDPNSKKGIDKELYISRPSPWRTVRDAISDLPVPVGTEIRDGIGTESLHFGRMPTAVSLKRYQTLTEEGMNRFDLQRLAPELTPRCWINKKSGGTDLFGRLWWDRPSVTIRTEFFKPEKGRYLHPVQDRPITHREAARFQSFPDNFVFKGSKIEIARQIGNAVAVDIAKHIANAVWIHYQKHAIKEKKSKGKKLTKNQEYLSNQVCL